MRNLLWILLTLPAACSPAPPKPPSPKLGEAIPTWPTLQSMEGRVGFEETIMVLRKGSKTIRSFEATVSGTRKQALFSGHPYVHDHFTLVKLLSHVNMPTVSSALKGLSVYTPLQRSQEGVRLKDRGDPHKLAPFITSLFAFSHTLPRSPEGRPLPLKEGLTWSAKQTMVMSIKGRAVKLFRTSTCRVVRLAHQGELHQAFIKGSYTSTSQRALKLGPFTVEIIGRGEFEAEFSLDRGVWTHITAKGILGWAGTYRSTPDTPPLTTGYRQKLHMNLSFTENQ